MNFLIINQQKKYKIPKSFILESVPKVINKLSQKKLILIEQKKLDLNIIFVSSKEIKNLNKNFRGKNKPTDILSFNSADPTLLGELILCPEVIIKQAISNHWPQKYEYLYMLIHGILHLLGYDHELDKDSKLMYGIQDQIFNQVSKNQKVVNDLR